MNKETQFMKEEPDERYEVEECNCDEADHCEKCKHYDSDNEDEACNNACCYGVSVLDCMFCTESFPRKSALLQHMKTSHDIIQPYQCISCLKRYSSYKTLQQHRRSFCRRFKRVKETAPSYTHPSFITECRFEKRIPTFGDMLSCVSIKDGKLALVHANEVVGYVPLHLVDKFSKFLRNGNIKARIAGAVICVCCKNGLEIPVDYIFYGEKDSLYKLIDASLL